MNSYFRLASFPSRPSTWFFQRLGRSCVNGEKFQASMVPHQFRVKSSWLASQTYIRFRSYQHFSVRGLRTSQPRFAGPLAIFLVKLAGPLSKVTKLAAIVGGR